MRAAEDGMVRWHYRLNGHAFAQTLGDSQVALVVKNPPAVQEPQGAGFQSQGASATTPVLAAHSSVLTWRIPWTEEPATGCKE